MNTADLVEKIRRYPVPALSGLIVLICFLAYYFRMDLITDLESRHDDVLDQRGQVDLNLVAGASLADHLEQMRAHFADLKARVVQPSELAENLNYFYQIDARTGVSAIDLKQNAPSDQPVPQNKLGPVGYSVSLNGRFAQIVSYFNEFEHGSRFYRLRSFRLERGRDANQAMVALSLNLELLGWQP